MWPNGKWNNAHFARRRQATAPPWALAFDGAPRVRPMCLKEKCRQALRQGIVTLGEIAPFCPPAANPMAASRSRCRGKVSLRGRGDEKANGDRVFCHFIDGRDVLRRRLAGGGTAGLPFGPSHARRMDRDLFWSQRRLRL